MAKVKNPDLLIQYKWDFLRRNPFYRKDYNEYIKSGSKEIFAQKIHDKYGIPPINYKTSFNVLRKKGEFDFFRMKFSIRHSEKLVSVDSYSKNALDSKAPIEYRSIPKYNKTDLKKMKTLRVALNMYYSKEKLLLEIERIIDEYKLFGKVANGAKLKLGEQFRVMYDVLTNKFDATKIYDENKYSDVCSRVRLDSYDRYLVVYDLKEKGYSWEQLAAKFYEGDYVRDPEYGKRKVKRDYQRCKGLIEGGYRQIR